jgi:hypothetical protein
MKVENHVQYSHTLYWIGRFKQSIAHLEEHSPKDENGEAYNKMFLNALREQLADLEAEAEDYVRRLPVN